MTKFKCNNSFKTTKYAFYERTRFKLQAYSDKSHSNLKQLNFSDLNLYGKVDYSNDSTHLNQDFLSHVGDGRYALEFVSNAFKSVKDHFKLAASIEKISVNEKFLSNLTCYQAYEDPVALYELHINSVMEQYNKSINPLEIKNINDYVKHLEVFANRTKSEFPITFSSWIRSKRCPIFISGLAINVSNNPFDDDGLKQKDFIDNPNFDFYVDTCKSRGFYVSMENPSLIVADINSTQMREFMNQNGVSSDLFDTVYHKSYKMDFSFLKNKITEYYGIFANNYYYITENKIDKNNKLYYKMHYQDIDYNINNNILYKLYINIKNIEEDNVFGESEIRHILRKVKKIDNLLDSEQAIDYINLQIRSTYVSKHGGLRYFEQKFKSMED